MIFSCPKGRCHLNSGQDVLYRRLTDIAHELGHYKIHKEDLKVYSDNDYSIHEWFKKKIHKKVKQINLQLSY